MYRIKMKHPVQLVETVDSKGNEIRIICNDAKVNAQEISDLYRNRWQIELFFKWVKQHLVIKKLYGKSENAVYNQLFLAMITFCLTLLMKINSLFYLS
ncbi:transposase [Oceanobacillus sojae]|uniref:transposase n=1 Tax=Oceanobacillus sojae TaxID=582851 RepID=UPI0021A3926E|nr:transposase [Oceanobacillus sojae]MCT1901610.1 transposase [Oceanobacillus sojae]